MKASLFIGEQRCRYLCTHSLINFWEFGFTSLRKNLLALLKIGRYFLLRNALQAATFLTLSGILSASSVAEYLHVGRTLRNQAGLPVCPAWDARRTDIVNTVLSNESIQIVLIKSGLYAEPCAVQFVELFSAAAFIYWTNGSLCTINCLLKYHR